MSKVRKLAVDVLSDSCLIGLEAVVILILSLILVYLLGLRDASLERQAPVVVSVAIAGGVVLEVLRRCLSSRPRPALAIPTIKMISCALDRIRCRNVLLPELAERHPDLQLFLTAGEYRQEMQEIVLLIRKRLEEDAKGGRIGGIAVLPAEKQRLVHYALPWYEVGKDLHIPIEWVEPEDMRHGISPRLGEMDKSTYIGVFRATCLRDELERTVPKWLAKKTGAKVGPVSYLTIAKPTSSV